MKRSRARSKRIIEPLTETFSEAVKKVICNKNPEDDPPDSKEPDIAESPNTYQQKQSKPPKR